MQRGRRRNWARRRAFRIGANARPQPGKEGVTPAIADIVFSSTSTTRRSTLYGDRRGAGHPRRGRPAAHATRKGRRIAPAALPSKAHVWRQFATRRASIGCLINGRPDRLDRWSNICGDRDVDPDLRRRCRPREVQCGRQLRTRPSGCPASNTKSQALARRRPGRS